MRVRAIQNVNIGHNGGSIPLEKGEEYDLPDDVADNAIRGKYAVAVEEKKPAARKTKGASDA